MAITRGLLLFLFCLIGLVSCRQDYKALTGRSYQVQGQVANCEGCQVILQLYDYSKFKPTQTPIKIDTVQNGQFSFSGRTTRAGFYEVHIQPKGFSPHGLEDVLRAIIYLPTRLVQLTADPNGLPPGQLQRFRESLQKHRVAGSFDKIMVSSSSPVQQDITRFLLLQDSLQLKYLQYSNATKASFQETYDSENRELINAWADSVRLAPYKYALYKAHAADLFIRQQPQPEAIILAMLENINEKTTNYRYNQYYKTLPNSLKTSYYGQLLGQLLTEPNKPGKSRQYWVGGKITYLKGKTPTGQPLDVLEIFRQNKLTFVNFWASWHAPSRTQMPDYQKLYEQNRQKGFEIIAVSFDQSQAAWTEAIAEAGLTFRHLSELEGTRASEYLRFRLRDIPFNILFDEKGTMVAVDLTPQELAQHLKQKL